VALPPLEVAGDCVTAMVLRSFDDNLRRKILVDLREIV
jgi:hypothetical protein